MELQQCLLADVGGTNIRLVLVPATQLVSTSTLPPVIHRARYRTADFGHLREALSQFVSETPAEHRGQIVLCALSVCGPVAGGKAICLADSMGPGGWVLTEADLAREFLPTKTHVRMLNDFVAVGLAVGQVEWQDGASERITVHAGEPEREGVMAVLGPGTGLGSCFGIWQPRAAASAASSSEAARELRVCPSEGGESDFVPRTEEEWALRQFLARTLGVSHVKVEHVVSVLGCDLACRPRATDFVAVSPPIERVVCRTAWYGHMGR